MSGRTGGAAVALVMVVALSGMAVGCGSRAETNAPSVATSLPDFPEAVAVRSVLQSEGYGHIVDGVPDATVDELGASMCRLAESAPDRAEFLSDAYDVTREYLDGEEAGFMVGAVLEAYCPDQSERIYG